MNGFTEKQKQLITEFSTKAKDRSPYEIYELSCFYIPLLKADGLDDKKAQSMVLDMINDDSLDERTRNMAQRMIEIINRR